jgi:hypothetical protein
MVNMSSATQKLKDVVDRATDADVRAIAEFALKLAQRVDEVEKTAKDALHDAKQAKHR